MCGAAMTLAQSGGRAKNLHTKRFCADCKDLAISATLRGRPHTAQRVANIRAACKNNRIKQRGGNGHLSVPQQMLWQRLGSDWKVEYPIKTKGLPFPRLPSCYKADLALPYEKIAVEIDRDWTKRDRPIALKKRQALEALGWTVCYMTNKEILRSLEDAAQEILSRVR